MGEKSVSHQEYLIESLKEPSDAAAYVESAMEDGDPELLLLALRNVAEAQGGMAKVAKKSNLNRETLYRTLSTKGNPRLKSLTNILDAFGLRLAVHSK